MARNGSSNNQRVDVVSTLICVYCLEIAKVADYVVLVDNSVATKHITSISGNRQGFSAIVTLHN